MYRHDKLRAQAAAKRLTHQDIAAQTGLSRQTVSDVLEGKANNVRLNTLKLIGEALGVSLAEVFEPAVAAA